MHHISNLPYLVKHCVTLWESSGSKIANASSGVVVDGTSVTHHLWPDYKAFISYYVEYTINMLPWQTKSEYPFLVKVLSLLIWVARN